MKKLSLILVLFLTVLLTYGALRNPSTKKPGSSNGLVAWYPFNGNANDESGNGSNPTYIGPGVTLTSDRFGNPDKAYYFDGNASSYMRMPADKFPTTDRTISFWFNAEQIANHPTPLSYGGEACYNSVLMIINKGDYPNAYTVLSHCASNFISAPYSVDPINNWYHLTMTICGATQKIFINGELQQTANTFGTTTVVTGKSAILGAILFTDGVTVYNEPTAGNFQGKMDDFRFYNTAMTDSEVKNLYNNEVNGLVAYFPFNGNANDESGKQNHGTVEGATLTVDRFGINGNAYSFDGANDFISIADNPELFSDEMTISWWYKLSEVPGGAAVVIGWVDGGHRYQQFFSGGELNYFNGYNAGAPGLYFNPIIGLHDLNVWKNVVVTYKKISATTSATSIFVDGELKQTDTHTLAINYAPGINFLIGKNHNGNYFKGAFDDLKIYNRILDNGEIALLYTDSTSYFPPENNVAAYYPFNGNANDESGNGLNGIVSGATLSSDRFNQAGKAYNFVYNGFSSDKIQVSGTSDLNFSTGGFSLSAWVKFSGQATDGNNYPIFSKHICGEQSGYILMLYNGKLTFWLAGSGAYNVVSTSDDYTDNSWHQVVAVYDETTQYIYVDGVLKNSIPFIYNSFNSANWALGGYNGCNGGFNGNVDEIKVFNQALTGTEIQNMYNKSVNELVVFLPFNGDAVDESGNGHDGTVYGGVLTEDRNNNANSAYTFPNLHDQIVLANTQNLNLPGGFSLNAWVKYKNINCGIVGKHNCWIPNGFLLGMEDGQFTLWISDGGWNIIKTNETFEENKWYMVTAVYDSVNKTGLVYVDGKLKANGNAIYSNFNDAALTISEASGGCPSGNMPGAIDEVKIYNRPLRTEEILSEYYASQTGLVAYYPFRGNTNDESGNNLHLTNHGAVLTADRFGIENDAYFFNGNANISRIDNDLLDLTNDFSISFWVKNPGSVVHQFVMSKHYAGEDNIGSWGIASYGDGNSYTFVATPQWGFGPPNPTTPIIAENVWHHITFTYKKATSEWKSFMDGLLSGSGTQTFNIRNTDRDFMIGTCMQYNLNLTAYLDDLRVYTSALTNQEIEDVYLSETTAPVLLSPENLSTVSSLMPLMEWKNANTNAENKFQLSTESSFTDVLYQVNTTNSSVQLPDGILIKDITYYWRVITTLNGETGPWSDVWSFKCVHTGFSSFSQHTDNMIITPNPANASFKIKYSIPATNSIKVPVTMEILNAVGECIKKIIVDNIIPGNYELKVETSNLQPGIYYCRLKSGSKTVIKKLVIIH